MKIYDAGVDLSSICNSQQVIDRRLQSIYPILSSADESGNHLDLRSNASRDHYIVGSVVYFPTDEGVMVAFPNIENDPIFNEGSSRRVISRVGKRSRLKLKAKELDNIVVDDTLVVRHSDLGLNCFLGLQNEPSVFSDYFLFKYGHEIDYLH